MKETRTDRCAGNLIGAQVSINRAVSELNSRENSERGRGPKPDDEYTLHCVVSALHELSQAAHILLGKRGARK
jgi:hypothetical protein